MPKGVIKKDRLDPRQTKFLAYYTDPQSETFSNGYQSAVKAGFSSGSANQIVSSMPDWLKDNIKYDKMLNQAERNLDMFVTDCEDDKIKLDATKFVAGRLGKARWAEKIENIGDKDRIEVIITDFKNTDHYKK